MSMKDSELLYQRINSSLNDSSTKQAYSFGRAARFKLNEKKDNYYHFYDLPDIRCNRSTTLGYGKKNILNFIYPVFNSSEIFCHKVASKFFALYNLFL